MAKNVNPDLQKERDAGTFDPNEMTYILDGGEGMTERRRYVESLATSDPVFTEGPDYHFLSRAEKYERGIKKSVHYIKKSQELGLDGAADGYWYRSAIFPSENPGISLHSGMFIPGITGQGTPEQQNKWLEMAKKYQIIGTYAQTEMGHGTHIRGCETTATYDEKREEFVIHSPNLTSTKWWPGGLGKTSNYVILMAQLIIKGKHYGLTPFIVQIRDMESHQPMRGVTLGDIGPKFGYDMIDNGYLRFDHYRIPRENMLMKNAQVQKDGTYTKGKHPKLVYGTMVFVRAAIVDGSSRNLAMAVAIATRYSCVRRQSELKPGAPEPQIIEYQTQQYKLFPLIASAYAYWFAGKEMRDIYFQINYEIQQGNVDLLPELHALSSGLKAFTSAGAMFGIEMCRLACGGHGYSHASGISKIYVNATPACTYEGENTVLLLQTARYLMKAVAQASKGAALSGSVAYIGETRTRVRLNAELALEDLVAGYKNRASYRVQKAATKVQKLLGSGHPEWEARNLAAVELTKASQAHCHLWVVTNFVNQIAKIEDQPAIQRALTQLCQLYAAHGIVENAGDFLEEGSLNGPDLDAINDRMLDLLGVIRPNAVRLVDSFDFTDHMLGSVLGRFDGNVYENLYKWAQNSTLNKTEVHESFDKYLKPLMREKAAKL